MSLSPFTTGLLLSAFFWSYALAQIGAGWLTDRFPVRLILGAGFAIWSVATLASGFAQGIVSLFAFRLVLGAGESVLFPSFSKIISSAFPFEKRALPNAILDAGTKVWPAIAVLAGSLLVGHYGWRVLFFILGGTSMLWLIPWMLWAPRNDAPTAAVVSETPAGPGPTILEILGRREAWVHLSAPALTPTPIFSC